jgi:uncharacterized protein YjbI with pentapeptide repeats
MAHEEHLDLLRHSEAWNNWRLQHPEIRPDLSRVDLRRGKLKGVNLRQVSLSETDLSWADLSGVNLSWTTLSESDLRRAKLIRTNLRGIHLGEANLSGADLSKATLMWGYLRGANMSRASLCGANLQSANLGETNLEGANLEGANLCGVKLHQANLSGARLKGADLSRADLSGVNLYGADVSGAIFDQSRMQGTILAQVDLTQARGLETVQHLGPSEIALSTIYLSQGNIPEVFLRGAGVPDSFIEYMRPLVGKPLDFYSCFISYSNQDEDFARRLYNDLQGAGVRCWFAPEDMKIGDEIRPRIDESIRLHDKLLLVLSEHSINSPWVKDEVEAAYEKENRQQKLVLFPVRLDSAVEETARAWATKLRRQRHIGDFTGWKDHDAYQRAFTKLLRGLKAGSAPAE